MRKAFPEGPRVLDFVDTAIFDYLIGNADRHHYETFSKSEWEQNSSIIMLDNGKRYLCGSIIVQFCSQAMLNS